MTIHLYKAPQTLHMLDRAVGVTFGAFSSGLAQAFGFGLTVPPIVVRPRSYADAMQSDWLNVGSDLYRGVDRERRRVEQR